MADSRDNLVIRHQLSGWRGAFIADPEGVSLAEMTYVHTRSKHIVIDHTRVDPALRGRGVARRLLDALVAWARDTGTTVSATCSYAREQFERDEALADVYDAQGAN